jgi:hypothetical protein
VDVLMGVEMGGRAADEAVEFGQLTTYFGPDGWSVLGRNNRVERDPFVMAIDPFAEIKMKADADFAVLASVGGRGGGGGLADHEAGAGDNTSFRGFDDAAIDAVAKAEVIGVDNEVTGPRCWGWTGGAWHNGNARVRGQRVA